MVIQKNEVLVFSGPEYTEMTIEGEKAYYPNVNFEEVVRILESKETLWGKASGATLGWCINDRYKGESVYLPISNRGSLVILYHSEFGFHIRYDVNDNQYVAIRQATQSVCVMLQVCGQPAYFPSATVFPIETAKDIVKTYIDNGTRFQGVSWVETSNFRYDRPDEWKKIQTK